MQSCKRAFFKENQLLEARWHFQVSKPQYKYNRDVKLGILKEIAQETHCLQHNCQVTVQMFVPRNQWTILSLFRNKALFNATIILVKVISTKLFLKVEKMKCIEVQKCQNY